MNAVNGLTGTVNGASDIESSCRAERCGFSLNRMSANRPEVRSRYSYSVEIVKDQHVTARKPGWAEGITAMAALNALLRGWHRRYRQRRALLSLDAAQLKDIGLSRADALREGYKPFWRR